MFRFIIVTISLHSLSFFNPGKGGALIYPRYKLLVPQKTLLFGEKLPIPGELISTVAAEPGLVIVSL